MIVVVECKTADACPHLENECVTDSAGLSLLTVADDFVIVYGWRGGYRSSAPTSWTNASHWAEPSRWSLAPGPGGLATHARLQKVWRAIANKYPRVEWRAAFSTYGNAFWASGRDCATGRDILVFEGTRGQFYAHTCGWDPCVTDPSLVTVFTTMPEAVEVVAAEVFRRMRMPDVRVEAIRVAKPEGWRSPSEWASLTES